MDSSINFDVFYNRELLPLLTEADKLRRQTRAKNRGISLKYFVITAAVIAVGFLINRIVYGTWVHDEKANVPLIIMVMAVSGLIFFCRKAIKKNKGSFVGQFKGDIIEKIVHFVDDNLTYSPYKMISERDFLRSKLFRRKPDSYNGDDFVSGTVGKTYIEFSEVHAKYLIQDQDEDGNSRDRWEKLFDGLIFKADFNKHFNGEYFIFTEKPSRPSRLERLINREEDRLKEKIETEDREFNRQFYVYGTDQVEARYILSASFMRRLLDFKQKTDKKIRLSFIGSAIYVAIPYKRNLFEPRYRSSVVDKEDTAEFYYDLRTVIDIVKELDLNTRIWSKQ